MTLNINQYDADKAKVLSYLAVREVFYVVLWRAGGVILEEPGLVAKSATLTRVLISTTPRGTDRAPTNDK